MGVAVTGGAGYVGSALVYSLRERGYRVLSVDNLCRGDYSCLRRFKEDPNVRLHVGDIRDGEDFEKVLKGFGDVEVIFHLAAISGLEACREHPREAVDVNVFGTRNVLEAARRLDIPRVIFASSAAVYGAPLRLPVDEDHPLRPLNLYGVTKVAGENLISLYYLNYGLETVILRLGNVYGVGLFTRWETVIPRFVKLGLEGRPLTIYGDGESSRDFVHIWDVVEALRLSAEAEGKEVSGEVFNVGGETLRIKELAELVIGEIERGLGRSVEVTHLPPRPGETKELSYSMEKIKRSLGFTPKWNIKRGIKQLIHYYLDEN
ncbi:NAD-dependent epimerase/dehydratase family protein [Candidatus Bathyarchaeota archaeon]|nr:NAD-dependent epimerase/dehydratase family protein [Candidatus Bathyarchaeota archaeon]